MKAYLAILKWEADGSGDLRLAKYMDFDTLEQADEHVSAVISQYTNAFSVATPVSAKTDDWLIDPIGKAIIISAPDRSTEIKAEAKRKANNKATEIVAELFVDLIEALLTKGVIVSTDFPPETRTKYNELKTLLDDWRAL